MIVACDRQPGGTVFSSLVKKKYIPGAREGIPRILCQGMKRFRSTKFVETVMSQGYLLFFVFDDQLFLLSRSQSSGVSTVVVYICMVVLGVRVVGECCSTLFLWSVWVDEVGKGLVGLGVSQGYYSYVQLRGLWQKFEKRNFFGERGVCNGFK